MKKLLTLVPSILLAACSADPSPGPVEAAGAVPADEAAGIQAGLRLGDSGPAVQALHARLEGLGYLPNDPLREAYPDWTPVVPKAPAATDRFDEVTQAALREYQARMRLDTTGIVDQATVKTLSSQTCGFPEFGHTDESWKFALQAPSWRKTAITWKLSGFTADGLSESTFSSHMNAAFSEWTAHSPFTFTRVSSSQTADISIFFGKKCCFAGGGEEPPTPLGALGRIWWDASNSITSASINFRSTLDWNFRLQSVALHEIGHLLGLHHSDPPESRCVAPGPCPSGPVMWYEDSGATSLRDDDITAIHAKYPFYLSSGAAFRSVVAGGDNSMWLLGQNPVAKGYPISKWTPSGQLQPVFGEGAVSIAVESNGVGWGVDNTGQVYCNTFMGWIPLGAAQYGQIAAGSDRVWTLGKTRDANNEADVYQFDGLDFVRVTGFKARSIAVDPQGRAWILRSNLDVYRRDGNTWFKIPKPAPASATAIKAGANGAIWIVVTYTGTATTYLWNENEGFVATRPQDEHIKIEARQQWLQVPGATANTFDVTTAKDGRLWALASNGTQNLLYISGR